MSCFSSRDVLYVCCFHWFVVVLEDAQERISISFEHDSVVQSSYPSIRSKLWCFFSSLFFWLFDLMLWEHMSSYIVLVYLKWYSSFLRFFSCIFVSDVNVLLTRGLFPHLTRGVLRALFFSSLLHSHTHTHSFMLFDCPWFFPIVRVSIWAVSPLVYR